MSIRPPNLKELLCTVFLVLGLFVFKANSQEFIPENANQYKRILMQNGQYVFGINAPISLFAAQIHKESTWNSKARSPYAVGLTQFTPETAEWIVKLYPELITAEPLNPVWAIRAMILYDKYLMNQISHWDKGTMNLCDHWAMVTSAYNGGYGWVIKDRRLAKINGKDQNLWWNNVELYSGRSKPAFKENRNYPKKILLELQFLYNKNGWGDYLICNDLLQ